MPEALPKSKLFSRGNIVRFSGNAAVNASMFALKAVKYEVGLVRNTVGLAGDIGGAAVHGVVKRLPYTAE